MYVLFQVEEKMRVAHERKSRKLKRLDERGAEAHKVDSTRSMIRSLSTKIRIAIQVVEKISLKINKLRDDELWPQLNELIQGYVTFMSSLVVFCSSICLSAAIVCNNSCFYRLILNLVEVPQLLNIMIKATDL